MRDATSQDNTELSRTIQCKATFPCILDMGITMHEKLMAFPKELASALSLLTNLIDGGFSITEWAGNGSIMNCVVGVDELFSSLSYKQKSK